MTNIDRERGPREIESSRETEKTKTLSNVIPIIGRAPTLWDLVQMVAVLPHRGNIVN